MFSFSVFSFSKCITQNSQSRWHHIIQPITIKSTLLHQSRSHSLFFCINSFSVWKGQAVKRLLYKKKQRAQISLIGRCFSSFFLLLLLLFLRFVVWGRSKLLIRLLLVFSCTIVAKASSSSSFPASRSSSSFFFLSPLHLRSSFLAARCLILSSFWKISRANRY